MAGMKRLFVAVVFGLSSGPGLGAQTPACDSDPVQMLRALGEQDPSELVHRWWDGAECEESLLEGISSGKREWLALAIAVAPHTDAWSAESLEVALGSAMMRAPSRVLPLVGKDRFGSSICYPWSLDDSPQGQQKTLAGLPRAIRMFEAYEGTTLALQARTCADDLRSVAAGLRHDAPVTP